MHEADPVSRLILDEAGDLGRSKVLLVDDQGGALATALSGARQLQWWGDDLRDDPPAGSGAIAVADFDLIDPETEVVLLRLPKGLDRLDEYAWRISRAAPGARIVAGAG